MTGIHPLIPFIVILVTALLISLPVFIWRLMRRRQIKRAPRIPINKFPEGSVGKIVGRVVFVGEPLKAPVTELHCAQYRVKVYSIMVVGAEGGSPGWYTDSEEHDSQDFILKNDRGEALIKDPPLAGNLDDIDPSACLESGPDVSPLFEKYLDKYDSKMSAIFVRRRPPIRKSGKLRCEEHLLEEGTKVTVYGKGHWENIEGSKRLVIECSKLFIGVV